MNINTEELMNSFTEDYTVVLESNEGFHGEITIDAKAAFGLFDEYIETLSEDYIKLDGGVLVDSVVLFNASTRTIVKGMQRIDGSLIAF